jgi:hypothetical protein
LEHATKVVTEVAIAHKKTRRAARDIKKGMGNPEK